MAEKHRKSPGYSCAHPLILLAYQDLQVPSNVSFELKQSAGKGWGAFATRKIERGAKILEEKPLFIIRKHHEEITEDDVWKAFQQLTPRGKQQFLCLRDNASKLFSSMGYALAENSFALQDITPMHGLFLLHSRFNHSCVPNAKLPSTAGKIIAIFATRDIDVGEEITFCYNKDFESRTRLDGHQALRFTCECKACLPGTHFQQLSEVRRRLIRGLQYLKYGRDLKGQRQNSESPIIIDSKLKEAAENFAIPLSARLIYSLLVMVLLEEEGLLDEFMIGRIYPNILILSTLFRTESNAKIAKLAIGQKTWPQKLCMAFRLWGRGDMADDELAMQLRILDGPPV